MSSSNHRDGRDYNVESFEGLHIGPIKIEKPLRRPGPKLETYRVVHAGGELLVSAEHLDHAFLVSFKEVFGRPWERFSRLGGDEWVGLQMIEGPVNPNGAA